MEPISNIDRLVALLRQRLLEQAKFARPDKTSAGKREEPQGIQALAAVEGIDDRQLKRALIQNILADQFGGAAINDSQFQLVVDRVTESLDASPDSSRLFARVIDDLRTSARSS
jgi:hypothetical protein